MADRTRGYAHRIDVRAPVQLLWRGLIDPKLLALWFGPGARIDAKLGGSYVVQVDRDLQREAHIDVFEVGRRLRLIYMPPRELPPNDAVMVDDFILDTEGDTAVLRLLGSGFPVEEAWEVYYLRLRNGWGQALQRLKICLERLARAPDVSRP